MDEIEEICRSHGVTLRDVMGSSRFRRIVIARHHCYWHIWSTKGWSLPKTGQFFGREHTSIANGIGAHMSRSGLDHPGAHWMVDMYRNRLARTNAYNAAMREAA